MEALLKNNIPIIAGILLLVILSVYLIVKIHEWLIKIAVCGLVFIVSFVIYFHYSGISLVDWQGLKNRGFGLLGVNISQLEKQKNKIAEKAGNDARELAKDLGSRIELDNLKEPLKNLQKELSQKNPLANNLKKSGEKDNFLQSEKKKNSLSKNDPSIIIPFNQKKNEKEGGLLEF